MFVFAVGVAVGAVAVGFVANRKPEWFAKVVSVANAVDAKANAAVAAEVKKV